MEEAAEAEKGYTIVAAIWDAMEVPHRTVMVPCLLVVSVFIVAAGVWGAIRRNKPFFVPYCLLAQLPLLGGVLLFFLDVMWVMSLVAAAGISDVGWPWVWQSVNAVTAVEFIGVASSSISVVLSLVYYIRIRKS